MEINMAIDKVREYFKTYQMDDHILEFDVSSATVELAAEALQCEGKRIAKTMSFLIGDQPILIVTAGDTKIDNAKYKHFFGAKAKMIPGNEVENIILQERQLELYGEGYRWFDLMRTGHLIEVMDPIYSARQEAADVTVTGFGNEGTKYWPIHYAEFESNKALVGDQNPPYTER